MKYFSLFSGIRGFEQAFPEDWECVGYSEIDPFCPTCKEITYQKYIKTAISQCQKCGKTKIQHAEAISKYHYPDHINYGDARRII